MIRFLIIKYLSRSFSIVKTVTNYEKKYIGYSFLYGYKYKFTKDGKEYFYYFNLFLSTFIDMNLLKNINVYQLNENSYIVIGVHK